LQTQRRERERALVDAPRLLFPPCQQLRLFIKIRFQSPAMLITLKQSIPITFSNNKKKQLSAPNKARWKKMLSPPCSNKFANKKGC
jgi:hypothetical protein